MSETKLTPISLGERLMALRAAASSLYDRGKAFGKDPKELASEVEPLQKAFHLSIQRAARNDLPGCVLAIRQFETAARGHEEDAKYLLEKADNVRGHAELIKDAIIGELKKDGVTERRVGDFTLVLTLTADSQEKLVLR